MSMDPQGHKSLPGPICESLPTHEYQLKGWIGDYLQKVTDQWLLVAPEANPAMLEMFRDRDRQPGRAMVPWAGEFAGKYLTAAVQVLRLTGDQRLRSYLERFVNHLLPLQAEDGYFGPWQRAYRFTNRGKNVFQAGKEDLTWDTWGHYHLMLGLLLWHETTEDPAALEAARKIADALCEKYAGENLPHLVDTGSTEMNLAPIHSLCLLYKKIRNPAYLDFAHQILEEFEAKDDKGRYLAGNYLHGPLSGQEFYHLPKPRWESLHPIMGLAELYTLTGQSELKEAFERVWWSIVKLDRHNNGGFSSGEQAQGNPYHPGAIETCCTIAWIALSIEMLRLTGNSIVADELELSTLNSVTGMHSASGRWSTYNTPMDGVRIASAQEIVFQSREGSPELNCCSVNAARGFGMISDWAIMQDDEGLRLNWYGTGTMKVALSSGERLELEQETLYPRKGSILITVRPERPVKMALSLRIPHWSEKTHVRVNGEPVSDIKPGTYLRLLRTWSQGDRIEMELDMTLHYWVGERECQGKASIYRGPILLAYDRRFNRMDPAEIPRLDARKREGYVGETAHWLPSYLLMEYATAEGEPLWLCDFGSAGEGGSPYHSWLKVDGIEAEEFQPSNPLRSSRRLAQPVKRSE